MRRKLVPNPDKCEIIVFDPMRHKLETEPTFIGQKLKNIHEVVYLGQLFSDDVKWSTHIKHRTKKAAA